MVFNSLHFLIFFIFTTTAFYTLAGRWRWVLLLTASAYFYASFIPAYLLVLGAIIVFDYLAGICIEKLSGTWRTVMLAASMVVNIAFLGFFKYYDFLNDNITLLLGAAGIDYQPGAIGGSYLDLALPIGLSFHTFQSMSYTIEVYRGNQKAERHFGIYALYVLFYPQLVAGPIERPQNVLGQFRQHTTFDWENLRNGLWLIVWGMFKKVVIADRLALVTDPVFATPETQNAANLAIAAVFYSVQIYCDFSGYSDIALGAARTMGFKLMVNFRSPYFSKSVAEFWQRWHISLSTWFRDYAYIPLGGNRRGRFRTCANLMVVFLLSGLWHGADWKFVIWGAFHGLLLIAVQIRLPWISSVPGVLRVTGTFMVVTLAWIFFRAHSVDDAILIIRMIATPANWDFPQLSLSNTESMFCLFLIMLLFLKEYLSPEFAPAGWRLWPVLGMATLICYLCGVFGSNQFIYFQF